MKIKAMLKRSLEPFITVDYYKKAVQGTLSATVVAVISTFFTIGIISGLIFTIKQLPIITSTVEHTVKSVSDNYPENLVFEWNGAKLTANTDSISIPWPKENNFQRETLPKQFLFYTNTLQQPSDFNFSPGDFLVFVNTEKIFRVESQNPTEWTSETLEAFIGVENYTRIDKTMVEQLTKTTIDFIHTHQLEIRLLALCLFVLLFLGSKIWFVLIETVLVVLLFKLYAISLTTRQTIILSLNVLIPTVVLTTIANLLYQDIPFPIQTLTFWILILFLSFHFKHKE